MSSTAAFARRYCERGLASLDVDDVQHTRSILDAFDIDLEALDAPRIVGNPAKSRLMFRASDAPLVHAQTPTNTQRLSWGPPARFADGTPIPATIVLTYNVYAKLAGAAEVKLRSAVSSVSITTGPFPVGQNNCYTITALNGSKESERSPEACGVVQGLATKPVTTVVIQ